MAGVHKSKKGESEFLASVLQLPTKRRPLGFDKAGFPSTEQCFGTETAGPLNLRKPIWRTNVR